MNSNFINAAILALFFLLLFVVSEILYHKFNLKVEVTRKLVHFSSGILSLSFPYLIDQHLVVLALCGSFLAILLGSSYFRLLPSINRVERKTHGSALFPIIVYLCFLAYHFSGSYLYYYIPLLVLAISDPLAALVGKKFKLGRYQVFGNYKTLIGSFAFLISAFACSFLCFIWFENMDRQMAFVFSAAIAIVTTLVEAILHRGLDNFFIPITTMAVIIMIQNYYQLS